MRVAFFLLGAFYLAGGVVVLVKLARERWIDVALEALEGGPQLRGHLRYGLLALGAALTATGGLALLIAHRAAPALMVANLMAQLAWLWVARRAFPPQDEGDAAGRAQTIRAAALYTGATAFVALVTMNGGVALNGGRGWTVALAAVLVAALAYAAWNWRRAAPRPFPEDAARVAGGDH